MENRLGLVNQSSNVVESDIANTAKTFALRTIPTNVSRMMQSEKTKGCEKIIRRIVSPDALPNTGMTATTVIATRKIR